MKFMLSEWNAIQGSFNKFEKKTIMHHLLQELSLTIKEGTKKDWKSINKQTYITKCTTYIDKLNKTQLAITKEITTIDNSIHFIEKMEFINVNANMKSSLSQFMSIQNDQMKNITLQLGVHIEAIKAAAKVIEMTIKKSVLDSKDNKSMFEVCQNLR